MLRAEAMFWLLRAARGRRAGRCLLSCALGALLAAPLAGQANAQAVRPQRIVSLDLCADQLLVDLVPRGRIAAVTHLAADPAVSAIPERARGLTVTRGGAEDVLRYDPDLVLAGPYGVSPTVSLLRRLDRNVVVVPLAADLEGVRTAVRQVARAVGEEARGEAMVRAFDARLAALPGAQGRVFRPASALIYQVGGSASGAGTLAQAALEAAGYRNASADYVLTRAGQVPLEALVAHIHLHNEALAARIEQVGNLVAIRTTLDQAGGPFRQATELVVGVTFRVLHIFMGAEWRPRLEDLVDQVWAHPLALVHADYSPKNLLVWPDGLMLVDFETAHYGDPAFVDVPVAKLTSQAYARERFAAIDRGHAKAWSSPSSNVMRLTRVGRLGRQLAPRFNVSITVPQESSRFSWGRRPTHRSRPRTARPVG